MMQARANYEREARAALRKPGQKVCRTVNVGIGMREWRRGEVVDFSDDKLAVRSEDGLIMWEELLDWTPCW